MFLITTSVVLVIAAAHVFYGRTQTAESHDHSSHSHAEPAIGSVWDNPPVGAATGATVSSDPPIPAEFAETLVGCDNLTITFEGERDTLLDLDHELLTMYEGSDSPPITVRYSDAACIDHPTVGPLIAHVLDEANEDLRQECETLIAAMEAGDLPTRGGLVPSIEDAEAHIERWC